MFQNDCYKNLVKQLLNGLNVSEDGELVKLKSKSKHYTSFFNKSSRTVIFLIHIYVNDGDDSWDNLDAQNCLFLDKLEALDIYKHINKQLQRLFISFRTYSFTIACNQFNGSISRLLLEDNIRLISQIYLFVDNPTIGSVSTPIYTSLYNKYSGVRKYRDLVSKTFIIFNNIELGIDSFGVGLKSDKEDTILQETASAYSIIANIKIIDNIDDDDVNLLTEYLEETRLQEIIEDTLRLDDNTEVYYPDMDINFNEANPKRIKETDVKPLRLHKCVSSHIKKNNIRIPAIINPFFTEESNKHLFIVYSNVTCEKLSIYLRSRGYPIKGNISKYELIIECIKSHHNGIIDKETINRLQETGDQINLLQQYSIDE